MDEGSGVTRGDRRRNARKARLRALVPAGNAVAGVDLGERKQALVVTGADGRVLARRSPRVGVHDLGAVLDWADGRARAAGCAGLTVACEPTGSRWMVVQDLCAQRGLPMVCVQPLVSHVARQQQDLTGDKTDEGDCVLIARLARELHCYVPEDLGGSWAVLREEGRRRAQMITSATAAKQLIRDKLGLVAPALLEARQAPFKSLTWLAAVEVVLGHDGGLAGVAALGYEEFAALVRAALPGWGGQRLGPAARAVFAALGDDRGVARMRRAALGRAGHALGDLRHARAQLARAEASMTASSVVKHAGMSPARNQSAAFCGKTKISRRGRPALRLAAWRAAWAVLRHCDVLAARHAALTSRDSGRLADGQARAACAASLLRWIYALIVHGTRWDPAIASGELGHHHAMAA